MRSVLVVCALLTIQQSAVRADDADDDYLIDHPDAKWWLSAQGNSILQLQPGFRSPYKGDNSLISGDNEALSFVGTIFGGYEITSTTAVIVTGESAGGGGLSASLGLAGFTNLDVVRNPTLGAAPYVGRAFVDQIIPLSDERVESVRRPLQIFHRLPVRRLELRAGKMSTADWFDVNAIGSDSHLQFMNWTVDNNGAYDYAADTRGYTLGGMIEYAEPRFAVRYGLFLMPTVANGIDYDFGLAHARGENLEVELHGCLLGHPSVLRILGFWNHAKMGRYEDANLMPAPKIEETRVAGRVKYGFGLNAEQEIRADLRVFARIGWNEGKNESFAFTEVDNTLLAGMDYVIGRGKLGVAALSNGISESHREYLALGGKGFLLGDGMLHYGREDIVEAYYTLRAYRGVFPALDVQGILHPGYNVDRGPVLVGSVRLHVEM